MKRAHVLVVDDEQSIRELLEDFLVQRGCLVTLADSGAAALDILDVVRPDLVLLDIWMPKTNGIDTLREIMALDPGLPVVMVTGNDDREVTALALRMGACDYVPKPLRLEYLEEVLTIQLMGADGGADNVLELDADDAMLTVDLSAYDPAASVPR